MKLLSIFVLATLAQAQPTFEVASVKRGPGDSGVIGSCHGTDSRYAPNEAASAPPLGRCVIRNGRLGHLLFIAYHLRSMSYVKGGPDWVKSGDDRFNIEAKVEDPSRVTEAELYTMLQALLIERFNVEFHRESKPMPGYALVVARNGPKLQDAKGSDVFASWGPSKPNPGQPNSLTARKYSIAGLADMLSMFGDPVIDKTGLNGAYDFTLSWNDTDGPSLFSALQDQLGLKLEPQKVPVSFFIVESAQKPTEN
jgi:uncharacterized protein (TIGR03435 family)